MPQPFWHRFSPKHRRWDRYNQELLRLYSRLPDSLGDGSHENPFIELGLLLNSLRDGQLDYDDARDYLKGIQPDMADEMVSLTRQILEMEANHPPMPWGNHSSQPKWLCLIQDFLPVSWLEAWYGDLVEARTRMMRAGRGTNYIRAAIASQVFLLVLNRLKLVSLELVERLASGIMRSVK